jgi:hypothetical protein
MKLHTSASFRAVAQSSAILHECLEGPVQPVTHTTLALWVRKIGYYALTRAKPVAEDWGILLDHSIQLGAEKLFVVLGVRQSAIDFHRPLRYQDLAPLWLSARAHWTGDSIADILATLQTELGQIAYAVGDYGSDLKKGLRVAGIAHVHDITHHIALLLKRLYAEDPAYQEVSRRLAQVRKQFRHTSAAHLIPPNQRHKSRYHNLRPVAEYGCQVLRYLDRPSAPGQGDATFREAMAWIVPYRAFFEEMREVSTLVCEIERYVKQHGLSSATLEQCCQELPSAEFPKARSFKFDIVLYCHTTLTLTTTMSELVCTSDILESAFGKYKNYVSCNPMAGITDLALGIAAFTCSLSAQEIQEALEHTTQEDVKTWSDRHIGPTVLKKRREAFAISERKK